MPRKDPTKDRSASDEVFAVCGKLGVTACVALARLRLLGPVLLHGPRAILVLFDYLLMRGSGWPSLVVADLDLASALGRRLLRHRCSCPVRLACNRPQQPGLVVARSRPGGAQGHGDAC